MSEKRLYEVIVMQLSWLHRASVVTNALLSN